MLFAVFPSLALAAEAVKKEVEKPWYTGFAPIALLLGVLVIVFWRIPKVKEDFPGQLSHLKVNGYKLRRSANWMVLGLIYAFLYWGRYNLNGAVGAIGGSEMVRTFNWIFSVGAATYGLSFLLNGPLTDRLGGRFAILIGSFGAAVMNALMGVSCWAAVNGHVTHDQLFYLLMVLYALNMYFQSFGAVAIVKCNSAWFHVRERGMFGAIFGILISLGIYFAFDWTSLILNDWKFSVEWSFFAPSIALAVMFVVGWFVVRNRPSEAGYEDINTGDATAGDNTKSDPPLAVFKMMLRSRVIMIIACIEFCSGFLRQAIMQMYRYYAKAISATGELGLGGKDSFVYQNWGLLLCCAGIMGGVFAGTISDHFFGSRRGPVAAILYLGMIVCAVAMCFLLGVPVLAWLMIVMSMCVIGVHGMLSGTASMDFGGSKNTGIAVGMIDGFVYAGTATQAALYAITLPEVGAVGAENPSAWWFWPMAMIPIAIIGFYLSYKIRNEKPKAKKRKSDTEPGVETASA
ncbi:MFS transporter [Candidatus Kuenenbacteria bacterium]|nr:MFS transporter [Candidatus Kuenenbacteria bacterium]